MSEDRSDLLKVCQKVIQKANSIIENIMTHHIKLINDKDIVTLIYE
jgi:hypothetical protein